MVIPARHFQPTAPSVISSDSTGASAKPNRVRKRGFNGRKQRLPEVSRQEGRAHANAGIDNIFPALAPSDDYSYVPRAFRDSGISAAPGLQVRRVLTASAPNHIRFVEPCLSISISDRAPLNASKAATSKSTQSDEILRACVISESVL